MTDTRNTQSAPPGRSLRRSKEQRVLAGVAGGLGEHLGINAWWFRWAFIFLALAGGAGVLLYIVAWIFIPDPGEEETAVSNWLSNLDYSDTGTVIGVALIGIAALIVATSVFDISGTMVTAAVLFAVGLLLYRGGLLPSPNPPRTDDGGSTSASDSVEDTDGASEGDGTQTEASDDPAAIDQAPSTIEVDGAPVVSAAVVSSESEGPGTQAAPRKPVVRQPRERSMLGRLTLATALIVVSFMALLDVSGISIGSVGAGEWFDPVHYAIAAMAVVAGGLLIGTVFGKAHWLIVIGFLLVPVLVVTALWPSSFDWSAGEVTHRPASVVEVEDHYRLGVGSMTVDLTELSAEEIASLGIIEASVGLGELVVWIPDDVGVVLTADIGAGEIQLPGPNDDGIGIDVERMFGPPSPRVDMDLDMGAGSVVIRQVERTSP